MAIVKGIREKVHLPIYDSLSVKPGKQLGETAPSRVLKFFVDVQKKTKLETNLQSSSLLPHNNTFEVRAMGVVISDLPPVFPDDVEVEIPRTSRRTVPSGLKTNLPRAMELVELARANPLLTTSLSVDINGAEVASGATGAVAITLAARDLEAEILKLKKGPSKEQVRPSAAGTVIGKVIYNTVTTLYVGEKIMIQMPTWFFSAGGGPYSESTRLYTHGEPSPNATFRFAEPIFIDKQQNFRVELEIPDTDALKEIQRIYGPLNIWVVLDGDMTRNVRSKAGARPRAIR
jgi:hypothetical protein